MLKTNEKDLVELLLQCQPGQPVTYRGWGVDKDGKPFILPSIGGITLNVQVGDRASGWAGDHIEPGVSCNANSEKRRNFPNDSLNLLSCVGNKAKIITGTQKGKTGTVLGHHGGSEHVIIDFPIPVLEKLTYDDKIMVHSKGQGLKLLDYPEIKLFNLDPNLLKKMKIKELNGGKLSIPVTTKIPAQCMGSGIGTSNLASGDYDVMTSDPETVRKYKLDKMRFGDFVAILDHDNSYGVAFKKGAISIGVVVHSDCLLAGHGPGITILMTSSKPLIEFVIDPKANLADLLAIGRKRRSRKN